MKGIEFQRHAMTITIGFIDPRNIPSNTFTTKFGREVKNPGGLQQPLLAVNVVRNSLVVGGSIHGWDFYEINTVNTICDVAYYCVYR